MRDELVGHPATPRPRSPHGSTYYYRRKLSLTELLPAAGVALAAGAVGFYLARLMLQRTPLLPPSPSRPTRPARPSLPPVTTRG